METIIIFKDSVVCDAASSVPLIKFIELRRLAKKEVVSFTFYKEYCSIVAKHTRKVKVPKNAYLNSDGLTNWIYERIQKAWKE